MKYELTRDTREFNGRVVHRIRALAPSCWADPGNLGGWVEGYHNLSPLGDCWIADEAVVYDQARVSDNAIACGQARLFDEAQLQNFAQVRESAALFGTARVSSRAVLAGHAHVSESARITGDAVITDSATIDGSAFITDRVRVFDNAAIGGSAYLGECATVHGPALMHSGRSFTLGPIGSRRDILTIIPDTGIGHRLMTGCFSGNLQDFHAAVLATHDEGSPHRRQYLAAIDLIRELIADGALQ